MEQKIERVDRRNVYPVRFSNDEYAELIATAKKEHITVADVIRRALFMKKGK